MIEESGQQKFEKNFDYMYKACISVIWVRTYEEARALKIINKIVKTSKGSLQYWDFNGEIIQYIDSEDQPASPIKKTADDPSKLFSIFASSSYRETTVLCVLDFNYHMENPAVIRGLKNSLDILKNVGKIVVFISPDLKIPIELEKVISVIDLPFPERAELRECLDFIISSSRDTESLISNDVKEKVIDAALGLTYQESEDAFSLAIIKNFNLDGDSIKTVLDQKCQILKKDGILEYIDTKDKLEDIGGLDSLKEWLIQRESIFSGPARQFGLPSPKGILLVGISGCGKSAIAKACASNWQIGLYRLDVGKVFTKLMGESEGKARKVTEIADVVAPCILWIDEIEKGMAGANSSGELDSGVTSRVMGTLLTWMQEKTSQVFIVATANDVSKLPPELLRKGRFDEIFFVDLPNEAERLAIAKIHVCKRPYEEDGKLIQRNLKPDEFKNIAIESANYTGAEIEQAIVQGLTVCFSEGSRKLTGDDVVKALKQTVPLSETMKDKIESLRSEWGEGKKARLASGKATTKSGKDPVYLRRLAASEK